MCIRDSSQAARVLAALEAQKQAGTTPATDAAPAAEAVSYTHLGVYKRQALGTEHQHDDQQHEGPDVLPSSAAELAGDQAGR